MALSGESRPALSVVVGSHNAMASIVECLEALERQRDGLDAEIIVVDNSTDGSDSVIAHRFRSVRLLRLESATFIPELWEAGIRLSTGAVVALTTAHCVPAPNWMRAILEAHEDERYVGIGGADAAECLPRCHRNSPLVAPLPRQRKKWLPDEAGARAGLIAPWLEGRRLGRQTDEPDRPTPLAVPLDLRATRSPPPRRSPVFQS